MLTRQSEMTDAHPLRHTGDIVMHICRRGVTSMAYFVLSPNGKESLNKLLSPDPDHLRGEPRVYAFSCKKIKSMGAIVFELRVQANIQTKPNA